MPKERINSEQELLDFVIQRYRLYGKQFSSIRPNIQNISKYTLNSILTDLLIIQDYAARAIKQNDKIDGTG